MQVKFVEDGIEKEVFVDRIKHYEDNEHIGLILIQNDVRFEKKVNLKDVTLY